MCEDYAAIEVPVYAVGGWSDGYTDAIPRLLAGLPGPRKGLIGPWSHAFPNDSVPGPEIGFLEESLRWWDHWLKGIDTGIMDEPMLRVWMQEYTAARAATTGLAGPLGGRAGLAAGGGPGPAAYLDAGGAAVPAGRATAPCAATAARTRPGSTPGRSPRTAGSGTGPATSAPRTAAR